MQTLAACCIAVALGTLPAAQGQGRLVHRELFPGPPAPHGPSPADPSLDAAAIHPAAIRSAAAGAASSGIVYTCDPNLIALDAQVCTVLNTTIAGLYSAAFTNANATIYIKLGNTGLGASDTVSNDVTYTDFRSRLAASQSGANDVTALAAGFPLTNPFGGALALPTALQRVLGYFPTNGLAANEQFCNQVGAPGCYDGVITISNSQPLYFRTGTITRNQYDIFTVAEHETDEILGTSSCAFNDCSGAYAPPDFLRYHSTGTRSHSVGTNDPCTAPDFTNACFSVDGIHFLHQYNNISGDDAGDWVTNCSAPLVQDAASCAGTAGVDISSGAEILVLDVIGYTLRNPPSTGSYTCSNTSPPLITFVDSASAYGGYPYFASGSWLEIMGTNLADPLDPRLLSSVNTGQWTAADFKGANAPTQLDGISVSINGKPAYVWYLSPGQLNVQAPEDTLIGQASIVVTNCNVSSKAFPFARQALAPGLLSPSNYGVNTTQYMIATFASDNAYVLNTSLGAEFGLVSRPAKPGDLIVAYGIGFGDVTPSILPGVEVSQVNSLVNPVTFSFGSVKATTTFSGLAGNFVGLYEFYITVPSGLANGDYQIIVTQNGVRVPQTLSLTVHN